jgi:hypothetical protein
MSLLLRTGCEKKGDKTANPSKDDVVALNLCVVDSLEETLKFHMSSSAGGLVLRWVAQSSLARRCAFQPAARKKNLF